MTGTEGTAFEVEEVFTEEDGLLVLSLGFASPDDPLDVLHIACGRSRSGVEPPPVEDLLYLERTDQDLACDGSEVIRLTAHPERIELFLTTNGADALGLPAHSVFLFTRYPALAPVAHGMLAAMRSAGQDQIAVSPPAASAR